MNVKKSEVTSETIANSFGPNVVLKLTLVWTLLAKLMAILIKKTAVVDPL